MVNTHELNEMIVTRTHDDMEDFIAIILDYFTRRQDEERRGIIKRVDFDDIDTRRRNYIYSFGKKDKQTSIEGKHPDILFGAPHKPAKLKEQDKQMKKDAKKLNGLGWDMHFKKTYGQYKYFYLDLDGRIAIDREKCMKRTKQYIMYAMEARNNNNKKRECIYIRRLYLELFNLCKAYYEYYGAETFIKSNLSIIYQYLDEDAYKTLRELEGKSPDYSKIF